jgi:c-di-AMP phosphodiesterase-like protein
MKPDRTMEVAKLKAAIESMLQELGISHRVFNRTLPRMKARGYKYFIDENGRKSSLRQRFSFLKDLVDHSRKEKTKLEEKELEENA